MRNIRPILFKLPLMLTCKEFEEFVLDYLQGNLPIITKFKFWMHLRICKDCRSYLKAYIQTINLGQTFFKDSDQEVPGDMPEELVETILKLKKEIKN